MESTYMRARAHAHTQYSPEDFLSLHTHKNNNNNNNNIIDLKTSSQSAQRSFPLLPSIQSLSPKTATPPASPPSSNNSNNFPKATDGLIHL